MISKKKFNWKAVLGQFVWDWSPAIKAQEEFDEFLNDSNSKLKSQKMPLTVFWIGTRTEFVKIADMASNVGISVI